MFTPWIHPADVDTLRLNLSKNIEQKIAVYIFAFSEFDDSMQQLYTLEYTWTQMMSNQVCSFNFF